MTAHTLRDRLITARDHLGWNYTFTASTAFNETYVTVHTGRTLACMLAGTKGVQLEDLPDKFGFAHCAECSLDAAAKDQADVQDSLDQLRELTAELAKVLALLDQIIDGNSNSPGAEMRRYTNRVCELYYNASRYFRPNPILGGRSHAQADTKLDSTADVAPTVRALWAHMEDLAEDGTRQWTRMNALQPLRTAEAGRTGHAGERRVRAVVRDDTERFGAIPSDPFGDNMDRALTVEAPRLFVHDTWELLDWDSRLPGDGDHNVANPAGATPAELELALTLYGQDVSIGAPSLQQLLDGVRNASA